MKRIVFFGTPELCAPYLDALLETEYLPLLVVTNPDRPVGRKHIVTAPPTKIWAEKHNVPVFQPEKLNQAAFDFLYTQEPDLFIVVAYGRIMPERFISLPKLGTINVHYSLLPRWRGASPVESTILAGDIETGVSIQQMRYELDSGPILAESRISLDGTELGDELKLHLSYVGAPLLLSILPHLFSGEVTRKEQTSEDVTTCAKIAKTDGELLDSDADITKWRKFRAYHGWPGVYYFDQNGLRVKVLNATLTNSVFCPIIVHREGDPKPTTIGR